ncbi:hypothetical protein TPHA_0D01750 [Tetrapisispora phaffii CBS 4417]|uniref:Synaptonemal complex protein ZIP1 n=1 Tax=Tetrapisispora phaffii (strain ATCC 24235 / CBS 4417 / NBRC 1672 / NRRL Y-8282 / UCD 70-5) TaxID=1071381 RepID=G8BSJ3_TETPH|nr:hypothetical protein TPHA_0D01750 [Tetrapisispora phaffii CBS 4417]CCE62814.1 hypothetical protein TPHA_0D01750 [Tetrapisispora phaffii CBS 4417]
MSNFFRDNSVAFKPRTNIFSRLSLRDQNEQSTNLNDISEAKRKDEIKGNLNSVNETFYGSNSEHSSQMFSSAILSPDNTNATEDTTGNIMDKKAIKDNKDISVAPSISNKKFDESEEDELEITEVRNLTPTNMFYPDTANNYPEDTSTVVDKKLTSINTGAKNTDTNYNNHSLETSSNDVLLDAFNNTQKICSVLKIELQNAQQDNKKLKNKIQATDEETNKLASKFAEYKKKICDLEQKIKWFDEQKNHNDNKLHDLKKTNQLVVAKINDLKTNYESIGVTVSNLKRSKMMTETELNKKNKEIEYLQKELDDCSGQLSEEKIRNNNLILEFNTIKTQNTEINESMKKNFNEFDSMLKTFINERFINCLKDESSNTKEEILKTFEIKLKENENNIKQNYQDDVVILKEFCKTENNNIINSINSSFSNTVSDSSSTLEKSIMQNIHNGNDKVIENSNNMKNCIDEVKIQLVEDRNQINAEISKFSSLMSEYKEFEKKLETVSQENTELKIQKTQLLTSIGTKEAQYEELLNQVGNLKLSTTTLEENEKCLKDQTEKLLEKVSEYEKSIERLKNLESNSSANYENKLASQVTISNTLTSENDMLKNMVKRLEESKEQLSHENNKKFENHQKLLDQVSELNIELVHLKAGELELKEENYTLKKTIENNKSNFEENSSSVKRFQQKIIELESDKQEYMSEKLDLLDKIEEKENRILKLANEVKVLEKETNQLKNYKNAQSNMSRPNATTSKPNNIQKRDTKTLEGEKDSLLLSQLENTTNKKRKKTIAKEKLIIQEEPKEDNIIKSYDNFDLSSSLNDDLEMIFPSQVELKINKKPNQRNNSHYTHDPYPNTRKKMLLSDDFTSKLEKGPNPVQTSSVKKRKGIK